MSGVESTPSTSSPSEQVKRLLQEMDDWDFEHFIADLWARQGWDVEVEQQSDDGGVDVRAVKETPYTQKTLIQAKRYGPNTTVGGPDIQQYSALKQQEADADQTVVVTTNRFTSAAYDRAEELNVKLIDGDELVALVDDLDAYDLVEKYTAGTPQAADVGDVEKSSSASTQRGVQFGLTSIPGISLERNWAKVTAYAAVIWGVSLAVLIAFSPSTSNPVIQALGIGAVFTWLGTTITVPVALYLDMKTIRRSAISWRPAPKAYLLGVLFTWYFALLWYFYNRRTHLPA